MSYTIVNDSDFSTYANPSVGGWIDSTSSWSIANHALTPVSTNYLQGWLMRPASEASLIQKVSATFTAAGGIIMLGLGGVAGSTNTGYVAWIDGNGLCFKYLDGSQNGIGNGNGYALTLGTTYRLDAYRICTGPSSTLIGALYVGTTLVSAVVNFDTASGRQVAGVPFVAPFNQPLAGVTTSSASSADVLGFIGDSITAGVGLSNSTKLSAAQWLGALANFAGVPTAIINAGVGGTATSDWIANGNGNASTALAAFSANGVTRLNYMLGTNDSKTASQASSGTYSSQTAANLAQFSAYGPALVHYQPYVVPGTLGLWDTSSNIALQSYQPKIDALINGGSIRRGDTTAFSYFQANQGELGDGVHPSDTGHQSLGTRWFNAYAAAFLAPPVDPDSSSSSSASSYSSASSDSSTSLSSISSASSASSASSESSSESTFSSASSASSPSSHSSLSSDPYEKPVLNAISVHNRFPTLIVNDDDPGVVTKLDEMVYQYSTVRTLRGPVTVEMESPYSDSEIRYTLNGKNPTPTSHRYIGPLVFRQNATGEKTTVKARIYSKSNSNVKSRIIRLEFRVLPSR